MARDGRSKESRACFECNTEVYLARDCKSKKGQSSDTSRVPETQGFVSFGSFDRFGLGLQRVHAEGQGSLQGPRRGIQRRCWQYQRVSNTSGR